MMRWAGVLVLVLMAALAASDEKKKDDKKKDDKKAAPTPAAPLAADLAKDAAAKEAAGDLDGAIAVMKQAVTLPDATGETFLQFGRLLDAKSELDLAMDAYKTAAEKLSGAAKGEALGRLSLVQEVRGSPEAVATADAATAADPQGAWPAIALSRIRSRAGKGDEAVALAKQAAAAGGGAAAATALGYAQEARGDLAAAEAAFREALAAEPARAGPVVGLARVLRKTGRAAEAEPMLAKVIETSPGAVDAYKESARVKLALNRPQDAQGDAAIAAALAESDPDAQRLAKQVTVAMALSSIAQNQPDLAIQKLTALRDQDPAFAEARVGLAKAYIAKRQPDAALEELGKAIASEPGLAEAHFQLGYVQHVFKRNAQAALASYEKAVAADPVNIEYRTNLGAVLSETGQSARAVEELTKVVGSPGYNRAEGWIYLGGAQLAAQRYKEAIVALDKGAALAPESALAQAYLGWSYFGLKDAGNFKKYAGKARSLGWTDAQLLDRLKRVEAGEPIK
jgi:tetratricopeptide (TPR) repeat protein